MNEPSIGPAGALLLGILQGLTEFLPVSSSGHLAAAELLVPWLASPGVTLELATHLGTTIAVVIYYRDLLLQMLTPRHRGTDRLLGLPAERWWLLLAVGTFPTALIGFAARGSVRDAFASASAVSLGLAITGVILMLSRLRPLRTRDFQLWMALAIGVAQGMAVFPGISRSGATITAALLLGLPRRQAVAYSLLMSIPAILGAALLDAVQLSVDSSSLTPLFLELGFATLAAGLVGYACIGFVHRATRGDSWHHFAWYCWIVAVALFVAVR